ncbi:hypothetical protein P7B00_15440 [Clostridium perfringens]|nr:hypothetical protein [Clostridium perfringens]MDK0758008.1 hypothetical protein [Clostridium perfringens]
MNYDLISQLEDDDEELKLFDDNKDSKVIKDNDNEFLFNYEGLVKHFLENEKFKEEMIKQGYKEWYDYSKINNQYSKSKNKPYDKLLYIQEYWDELEEIRRLIADDDIDSAIAFHFNSLKENLIKELDISHIKKYAIGSHYLLDYLKEIESWFPNKKMVLEIIDGILDEKKNRVKEREAQRQYDRNYKPKRQEKRKNVKSEAKIKREKLYEEYRALLEAGFTLEQIGTKYGKSKQAISNFLRRNEKLK